jgi:hypothetical protein
VQTDYVYETEAEFEADKDNIPVGATVIKLYEYPDNLAGFMVVPDYANKETTNRILQNGDTWTVQKTGFIVGRIAINMAKASGGSTAQLYVNNVIVSRAFLTGASVGLRMDFEPIPVSAGDVVKLLVAIESGDSIAWGTGNECYFIPPKFIKKELPVVVEKNGSYSLDEVRTAETWIDGKPIYRRVFAGTISTAANTAIDIGIDDTPIYSELVSSGGWWGSGGNHTAKFAVNSAYADYKQQSMIYVSFQNTLRFSSISTEPRSNDESSRYKIWVEYTKLID